MQFLFSPKKIDYVACSGGVDSMVLLDFLLNAGHRPSVLFFHHKTETSEKAVEFVKEFCDKKELCFYQGFLAEYERDTSQSLEEFWREQRYKFFEEMACIIPKQNVALAHHLNDVAETWLFSALHGESKLIPFRRGMFVRPLLAVSKEEILQWAEEKQVEYVEDKSNEDLSFMRNRIRHRVMPEVLKINPGFLKVLKKKVLLSVEASKIEESY